MHTSATLYMLYSVPVHVHLENVYYREYIHKAWARFTSLTFFHLSLSLLFLLNVMTVLLLTRQKAVDLSYAI